MKQPAKLMIGVHLDLKYMMPSKRYLLRWLRTLPRKGINTLLLEYEDKFPFRQHPFLRDPQAFTPEELRKFLDTARDAGLRVIPLLQTLSHLEFALAHDELADLREAPDIHTQICPCNPSALAFVGNLIEEVTAYHEPDEWMHLGMDEAWFMGTCTACRKRMDAVGKPRFWADHLRWLLTHTAAGTKRVMVWDDIFWGKPDAVAAAELPPGLGLVAWNYSARRFPPGGDLDLRVSAYRVAGCEVIGAPCLNWGVLTPQHDHCLRNTVGWADAIQRLELSGMLNTSWACFHVPLPMQSIYEFATGAAFNGKTDPLSDIWQAKALSREYGCDAGDLPQALRHLGVTWEQSIEGLGRPITPIVYGNMDMVLQYPGGQEERRRRGAYPLDWDEIDFNRLLEDKISALRRLADRSGLTAKLSELESGYAAALETTTTLALNARRHRREARLLADLAELKLLATRIIRYRVLDQGDAGALRENLAALAPRLAKAIRPFLEKPSCNRALRLWIDPLKHSLT